jgi:hypothetical protein
MNDDLDWLDDEEERPIGGPKSGIIVVAVANFLVGVLLMVGGLIIAVSGLSFSADTLNAATRGGSLDQAAVDRLVGTVRAVLAVMATVALVFGGLCLAAGLGVVYRQAWGRILSLVLGFGAGLLALLGLLIAVVDFAIVIPVLYGGYALVVLLILFDKDYSRQFR